jgi:chromate reductase, NAD(P)H dehydrogenase (quinone)
MESRVWNVGVLIGSLRKASFSHKLALALRDRAPSGVSLQVIEIGAMPLYNQDDESVPPESWVAFRRQVKSADALLFVTPEYNRSIPSALKNAIDVGSRPKGSSVYDAKPAAVISLSPGVLGAFGANHHLRQSLMCLNVRVMPAPEAYIGGVDKLFGDDGSIAVESTRHFLDQFMRSFAGWIERFKPAVAT